MKKRRLQRSFALLAVAGIVLAACGGDDDDATGDDSAATSDDGGAATSAESGGSDAVTGSDESGGEESSTATETTGEVDTEVTENTVEVEDKYGGEIIVGLEAEAVGLRPWEDTCSAPCYNMTTAIYDKLVEQTKEGGYEPWLAESIEPNDDFTVWTMMLRPGVAFHDGTPLTAQTIVDMFPIQQTGSNSSGSIKSAGIESVEATGDLEVTYNLKAPNATLPAALSRGPLGMVFQPAAAAADPDGYSTNPIGTGPFMIESRDIDNETVVVRNPDWWGTAPNGDQLPYLDKITFRPIPDEGTRLDALLSGTVDAFETLRQGTIRDARAAVEDGGDFYLLEQQGNNVGGGMYNVLVPPLDDVRVRRALTLMNSQDQAIEALGGTGISAPGTQWFSPDSPWFSEKVAETYPAFDFEAGVAELQGYVDDPGRSDGKNPGDPISVELSCPPDPSLTALVQVLEQTWTASGLVDVTLSSYDQQTHINIALGVDNGFAGDHQVHCWRWGSEDDPAVFINPFLGPPTAEIAAANGLEGIVEPLNFSNWFNKEAYDLAEQAKQTDDFETRKALYEQIDLIINEEVPIYFSGYTATGFGVQNDVQGINGWHLPSGDLGIGFPGGEARYFEAFRTD